MDRIDQVFSFLNANPTLKQLQDNTQRNSSDLRSEDKVSRKDKSKQLQGLDQSAISGDATGMSDDLMGSMDPDMFKGRRHAYRRQQDEEEEAPREKVAEPEPAVAAIVDAIGAAPEAKEEPVAPPAEEAPAEPAAVAEVPAAAMPVVDHVEVAARAEAPPVAAEEEEDDEEEFDEEPGALLSHGPGLLMLDEGFLIADGRKRRRRQKAAPTPAPEQPIPDRIASLLDEIVMDCGSPRVSRIRQILSRFGVRALSQCRDFGVRVALHSPDRPITTLLPRLASRAGDVEALDAAYFTDEKLCCFTPHALEGRPEWGDPVVLTFAIALDHAMGEEGPASMKSPAVLASFAACRKQDPGHVFLDAWCAISPMHYFAQVVEAYLTQASGPLQEVDDGDVYCSRSQLYDLDRTIYQYVDYLFRDSR